MLFAFPDDILGSDATITSSGATVDADYPLTNLHDGLPTEPCLFTDKIATRIIWDFTSDQPLEGIQIVNHTFDAATVLKVEANATNAWGAPSASVNVTVLSSYDRHRANVTADLRGTGVETPGYRYVSLYIPAQTYNHGIGEILLIKTWQQTNHNCLYPVRRSDVRRVNVNQTSYGVKHTVERLVRQRRFQPQFALHNTGGQDDRLLLLKLYRQADGSKRGWPCVLKPDTVATEEQYYVSFHPDMQELEFPEESNRVVLQADLLEIQRGLPLA